MSAHAWPIEFQHAPWTAKAACRGLDTAIFFPEPGQTSDKAKAVCATCPVTAECLALADVNHERHGIWGGEPTARRRRGYRTPPIRHGTRTGYQAELRRGLEPCQECRDALARYKSADPGGAWSEAS